MSDEKRPLIVTTVLIIFLAITLRLIGINWDNSHALHPDERMLILVTTELSLENLNPDFFNYGNFPVYLLKAVSSTFGFLGDPSFAQYPGIILVGRVLSALFDSLTTLLVIAIGAKVWNKKVGLISGFLYATAVFPLQNAHYFTVDTMLTFWFALTLYLTLSIKKLAFTPKTMLIGVVIGIVGATKIPGILALAIPGTKVVLQILEETKPFNIKKILTARTTYINFIILLCICVISIIVFFATQPYAFINFDEFLKQVTLQTKMSKDATIFPYTLQFIGTKAYLTPIEDIIRWGLGFVLGFFVIAGTMSASLNLVTKKDHESNRYLLIICFVFLGIYFLLLGRSAVKFMRYYLPLYPLLILFGGYFLNQCTLAVKPKFLKIAFVIAAFSAVSVWPVAFISIYFNTHPRVEATNWINTSLPAGSTIAVEHWDDRVPLINKSSFQFETLEVYQPETPRKWRTIEKQLQNSDYLIISSKRVYRSIMNWPERYPDTTEFYKQLFANETDFKLLKAFTNYPSIALLGETIEFNDDDSQESFTSYDHPKVLVFAKQSQ